MIIIARMLKSTLILLLGALALGCGNSDDTTTSTTTGTGGTTTSAASGGTGSLLSTSSSSSGGGGAAPTIVGPDCTFDEGAPFAPIQPGDKYPDSNGVFQPVVDEEGNVVDESDAIATRCLEISAPSSVSEVCYWVATTNGFCAAQLHTAWVTLETGIPEVIDTTSAIVTKTVGGVDLAFTAEPGADFKSAMVCIPLDVQASTGRVCLSVQLPVQDSDSRACVVSCKTKVPEAPEQDRYSNTVGGVVQCPDASGKCAVESLDASPTATIAEAFENDTYDLRYQWQVSPL